MEFRLLGPLEVLNGELITPIGGAKQRALLAILLLHANEVVSRDRLLDELWSDRPPGAASHSLDHQISRLRKTLEPAEMLATRPGGYVLQVAPEQVDARRFESLYEEGRRENASGRPAEAADALREALGLWRGDALADLAYEPFARIEIDRLEELRLAALEERIDAELALGRHQALVAELESLVSQHPLRERLHGQLMLVLYRSGRQAEALRVYTNTRRRLVEELGLEPSPALQQLEQAILRQDPSLDLPPATERSKRRRRILAPLALVLAAVAAAIGVLLAHGGTQSSPAQALAQPNSVALLAAASGKLIGQTEVQAPLDLRFGEGALWSLSFLGILTKIDPATGEAMASVNAVPVPCGLAVGAGSVWVTDCTSPTVVRVDPSQPDVVADRFPLPVPEAYLAARTQYVAVGAGSVWVGQGDANPSYVYRLDPRTGRVQQQIVIAKGGAQALAFADGAVWVGGGVIGHLSRIDARTNEVTSPAQDFGSWLCCVAAAGGYVWAAVIPANKVWKIGEDGTVVNSIRLPGQIENLTYADGAVWASVGDAGTVIRIDPTTDATRAYRFGHHTIGVAARSGVVAVNVQPSGHDVTADLEGRIVTVALNVDSLDATSTDPVGAQSSFNADQVQFHYATCAKLFNYPDASGAAGATLVPEVAAGWPAVTDGGRTYTFRIRPGYGFSPPSHEHVTAESFRHEIERFVSPKQPGPWSLATLADVVGAKAYNSGRAAHVSGVSAHGDTLVIRLVKPAGDLPTRLARPAFCAVPADLVTVPLGVPYPIPTAGPYYVADRTRDVVVLRPNPNYHGSRPRNLDAIVYRIGVDAGTAAERIDQGSIDHVATRDGALAPNTAAARQAGGRYRLTANNWTERLALNARRPLFADARVRRAVAYAVNRRSLAHALRGGALQLPTSHLLPPNVIGSAESGYRLAADQALGRKLMRGRQKRAVLAAGADSSGELYEPELVETLRRQLAGLGIVISVVPLPQSPDPALIARVLAHADIATVERNAGDAGDPVSYLLDLPYLPAADHAQLERIATQQSPQRDEAAAAMAAKLEREALYIGYADSATPELVSRRVGCVIHQPQYPGVDLAALCLKGSVGRAESDELADDQTAGRGELISR